MQDRAQGTSTLVGAGSSPGPHSLVIVQPPKEQTHEGFQGLHPAQNLIELAVAFIIGAAFATLVKAFTDVIVELLAKAGGAPSFDEWTPFGMSTVGPFLTALVAFLLMAFIVYFFIVKPYEVAKAKFVKSEEEDEAPNADTVLLTEIRDALLRGRA